MSDKLLKVTYTLFCRRKLTIFAVVHDLLIEALKVFGVPGEGDPVARHCVPAAHSEEPALVILAHEVVQHGAVIDEGLEVSANDGEFYHQLDRFSMLSGFDDI